ncbi:AAA family ATPase, partial [Caedibacter taeniospiralis]|uniref:AAA family ATPase n=1 Tax=Caedibacter taeniospiralis TaxID=28907 RepID=UPI0037BF6BEB
MAKKIYIGSSNFAELITENAVFVDKSLLIRDMIEDASKVVLITRPRRFGKTLNMSMLHHFFAAKIGFIETRGLFDHLAIAMENNGFYLKAYQGKYPVIFVSFKDIKARDYQTALEQLSLLVRGIFRAHYYLLESAQLNTIDKETLSNHLRFEMLNASEIDLALRTLSELLYKHYQQKVVILIDEYDTPLNAAYVENYI